MRVRADVAELLRAGLSNQAIARQLGVDPVKTVARARAALGLPNVKSGIKPAATTEDLFWRRVKPTDDDHMEWTGPTQGGTPILRHGGRIHTAYRIAYRIANGRDPEGNVYPSCVREHCVKPGHHADRIDREREKRQKRKAREREQRFDALYAAIFEASA